MKKSTQTKNSEKNFGHGGVNANIQRESTTPPLNNTGDSNQNKTGMMKKGKGKY